MRAKNNPQLTSHNFKKQLFKTTNFKNGQTFEYLSEYLAIGSSTKFILNSATLRLLKLEHVTNVNKYFDSVSFLT